MDSVPSYEFHKIFRRVSYTVDLKGAFTAEDIDERLEVAQVVLRTDARRVPIEATRKRLHSTARGLKNLQQKDFAERTIAEASRNPYGIISLTLQYGRKKAEDMKLAFERSRIRCRGVRRV